MTKKKTKKNQKASSSAPPPADVQKKEKEDDLDMLEDIKRDEDLYISEYDVTNISNFIRTTNKSFNSLGNTVLEKFNNRCSLAILHALIALFDLDSEDREDVIRRLNIIYIVWRLPDLEQELRMKPTKTMSDVYCHPFSTFLFYAEQLEKHKVEATLARIIVTNNVSVVEKLTAPDFMQKAMSLDLHKVDREGFEKWAEANTDHWPEITEEMVSLSKAMRELGTERKDYEAGMAEAFYPLVHNPPTMLPPRMIPLDAEDPIMKKYLNTKDPNNKNAAQVIYSMSAGEDMQEKLKQAFIDLEPTVVEYQSELFSGMTPAELDEAQKEVIFDGVMAESSDSEVESESDTDSEADAEADFRAMTAVSHMEFNDKTIEGCVDRILAGTTLTTAKSDMMIAFVKNANMLHPQYNRLLKASEADDAIINFVRTNVKFAGAFLIRNALSEQGGCKLFKRYLKLAESMNSVVHALETVLKIAKEFMELHKMTPEHREAVLAYVRHTVRTCEETENPPGRTIRLVAMLVKKLLRDHVVSAEEIAAYVKPFTLKFSENRECTALYKHITGIQAGGTTEETVSTTSSTSPSMMTTTTTTTSVNTNATSTTTTTTVVKQCGPAVIKQTSRKVVLQASAFKALGNIRSTTAALFRKSLSPAKPTSSTVAASLTATFSEVTEVKEDDEEEEEEEEMMMTTRRKRSEDDDDDDDQEPPPPSASAAAASK